MIRVVQVTECILAGFGMTIACVFSDGNISAGIVGVALIGAALVMSEVEERL